MRSWLIYTAADVSINLIIITTSLKSIIFTTTSPFEELYSRACCPRRVDEVGGRDNELEWWFIRNTGRGVAIVYLIMKCSDPSQFVVCRVVGHASHNTSSFCKVISRVNYTAIDASREVESSQIDASKAPERSVRGARCTVNWCIIRLSGSRCNPCFCRCSPACSAGSAAPPCCWYAVRSRL
jgi:hypothetical protein